MTTIVTDETFATEVLQSTQPVLVDFWAEWCGPCKAMAPALDQLADEMAGKVKIVKLDVDKNPTAMETYGVRAMPTLILFKDGKAVTRQVGAVTVKAKLEAQINGLLAAASKSAGGAAGATTFKLANGMDVVVVPDIRAPMVSHALWYRAGEADAPADKAGVAVVLERLMGNSIAQSDVGELVPGQYRQFVMSPSCQDATGYHHIIGKDQLQTLMQTEARRMTQQRFTDEEVTATPQIIADGRYLQESFGVQMRIGSTQEFGDLSGEDVTRFYERHYTPNKAVLVVCGDVTSDEVKALAEATYGAIPAGAEGARALRAPEPQHDAARRVIVRDRGVGSSANVQFNRAYYVPGYVTAKPGEAAALELLAQIIQESPERKLDTRKLRMCSGVTAEYAGSAVGSGTLDISLRSGVADLEPIERAVDAVLDDLRLNGVSEAELASAKTALTPSDDLYDAENHVVLAVRYGTAVAIGRSIEEIEGWPAQLAKVTTDDIKKVANAYLDPARSVTGWLLPDPGAVAQDAQLAEAV